MGCPDMEQGRAGWAPLLRNNFCELNSILAEIVPACCISAPADAPIVSWSNHEMTCQLDLPVIPSASTCRILHPATHTFIARSRLQFSFLTYHSELDGPHCSDIKLLLSRTPLLGAD